MTDLIHDFAKIEVPHDLLDQINIKEVLSEFRARFNRLGDLKRARNAHEERNWFARKWYQDEMDGAQLDAQELQADFAKSLAQLMVISLLQSQRLEQQQRQIGLQQDQIAEQTREIEQQTKEISGQQHVLEKQANDLRDLVEKYFELRGLTYEGAKKLIAIAEEVKSTRDDLLSSVATCIDAMRVEQASIRQAVEEKLERTSAAQADAMEHAEARTVARFEEFNARLADLMNRVQTQTSAISAREQVVAAELRAQEARATALDTSTARLEAMLEQSMCDIEALRTNIRETRAQAASVEAKLSAIAEHATLRARWGLAVAAGAILISVGALAAHWVR
ncbi:hypothetical protein [Burkholderia gladioli]|uniref:hypothetical protein n=1 Tax=Burkholderia gladioli TaxID=28095 RepID=UPI000F0BD35F|nr:hypothetical protein [Burkholderia gladioli]AYQ86779.1 hypothetical protein EDD84_04815 [Burkholderia gladioli]